MNIKWLARFFVVFYVGLITLTAIGLYRAGISGIQANIFYFVLLGLFCLPFLVSFIPSLESISLLGVEFKLKELEENKKHIKDLEAHSEDYIKRMIFNFVKEDSLTREGRDRLVEFRNKKDEI